MTSQYPSKKLIIITTTMTSIQNALQLSHNCFNSSYISPPQYINNSFYCRIIVRIQTARYFNNNNKKQKSVNYKQNKEMSRKMIETL